MGATTFGEPGAAPAVDARAGVEPEQSTGTGVGEESDETAAGGVDVGVGDGRDEAVGEGADVGAAVGSGEAVGESVDVGATPSAAAGSRVAVATTDASVVASTAAAMVA